MPCDGPKALSLLQISFPFTGWLLTFSGGSFGGEIVSRKFCQNVRYQGCQSTAMRERIAPRAAFGGELKYSLRLATNPVPNSSWVNTVGPLPWPCIFTGRSNRNSLTLAMKPSDSARSAAPKWGEFSPGGTFSPVLPVSVRLGLVAMSVLLPIPTACGPSVPAHSTV